MSTTYLGINIGGTNCSVCLGAADGRILRREAFPTGDVAETLARLQSLAAGLVAEGTVAVGISCGGPLDAAAGLILSPPNLPGWDRIEIVRLLQEVLAQEALPQNLAVCEIVPSVAGEAIGDLAALAVARYHAEANPLDAPLQRPLVGADLTKGMPRRY